MSSMIAADMLMAMRGLPITALVSCGLVGIGLIVTGWWMHRFWAALTATLAAGLTGLRLGPDFGMPPIIAGVLAAVAAGCLALSLVRVGLFVGCGVACWLAAQTYTPKEPTPVIALVAGGLLGVFMFRFWIIVITSGVGVVLVVYNTLVLLEHMMRFDAVQWTAANASVINTAMAGSVFGCTLLQYWIDKFRRRIEGFKQEWQELHAKSGGSGGKGWFAWLKKAA